MKYFENQGASKAVQTFMENTYLAILEYILTESVDAALDKVADVPIEDIQHFPHVAKALMERQNRR
jgi:hypothetical protein